MAKKKKDRFSNSVRIENRKARHDYTMLDKYEAGVSLTGCEVKSIREGHGSLNEVYVVYERGEVFLRGMHIKPYEEGWRESGPAVRDRKLLLHRREIDKLASSVSQKGLTIVPLALYFNDKGLAKVLVALARGKQEHDKRATIKERTLDREVRRENKLR